VLGLAVLDFRNYAEDLKRENVRYFADLIREATLRANSRLEVMTRENLLVLLKATGKDASQCEGECEVDTGRRIDADLIVSGEIQRLGSKYKISLRLHETHDGRLLSAVVASGANLDELDASAARSSDQLLKPLR
jgi:TolB-like protein